MNFYTQDEMLAIISKLMNRNQLDHFLILLAENDPKYVSRSITALVQMKDAKINSLKSEKADLAYSFSTAILTKNRKSFIKVGRGLWNGLLVLRDFFNTAGVLSEIESLIDEIKSNNPDLKEKKEND